MKKIKYSQNDFLESSLPTNRRRQFFDIIKIRWRTLFLVAGILFASSIPLFIAIIFKDVKALSLNSSVTDKSELANLLFVNHIFFTLIFIPCIAIIFVTLSGLLRIYRNIIWGEGVFFWKDFILGIKQNGIDGISKTTYKIKYQNLIIYIESCADFGAFLNDNDFHLLL